MKIPKINSGEFIIMMTCSKTGQVLDNDGNLYLDTGENYYIKTSSMSDALIMANKQIKLFKDVEILIYDDKSEFIELIHLKSNI